MRRGPPRPSPDPRRDPPVIFKLIILYLTCFATHNSISRSQNISHVVGLHLSFHINCAVIPLPFM